MFKIQSINNNKEQYIFHPRTRLSKTLHGSFSGLISSRDNNTKRSFENINFKENTKLNINEDPFYKLKRVPPIYFYRKIRTPYKYNIVSVPEYLVKTDEEKHFMEKLNQLMVNEPDRKTLNNLIKKKEKETKFKDRYKPSILDVQNILRYKPSLYSNSFLFEKKSNSVILKNNSFINNEKTIDYNKEKKYIDKNNNNTIEVNENKEEKNYINGEELKAENKEKKDDENSKEKKDELSEDEQIKLKYKISDIYNLRNEKVITNKSAEKYLFKNTENKNNNTDNNFYTTSKSKSDWIPNRTIGSKMNSFSSVSYNILSPLYKGFNKFISPSELNKNNLYNESNAFHRVKSISEFIDLTRVSASNTLNCFNRNRKNKLPNFKYKNSVATNQLDEYHINRDLIEKPI
jgi:hypothetical protein